MSFSSAALYACLHDPAVDALYERLLVDGARPLPNEVCVRGLMCRWVRGCGSVCCYRMFSAKKFLSSQPAHTGSQKYISAFVRTLCFDHVTPAMESAAAEACRRFALTREVSMSGCFIGPAVAVAEVKGFFSTETWPPLCSDPRGVYVPVLLWSCRAVAEVKGCFNGD